MKLHERELAASMLEIAAEKFSNHGCNDVEESLFGGWTLEQRQEFARQYHEWNGDPEEYDPKYFHLPDWAIMSFLADRLRYETQV